MNVHIISLKIGSYKFNPKSNPYEGVNVNPTITLSEVAKIIFNKVSEIESAGKLLIRGVQSGKHEMARDKLISLIAEQGAEYKNPEEPNTIFAAPYTECVIQFILEGFHKFKPKSEDRPQYPVDLWLIYDITAYKNVGYLHPRHNVISKDKWKRVEPDKSGLIAIIKVN